MIDKKEKTIQRAAAWAKTGSRKFLSPEIHCSTRDVFQARLESGLKILKGTLADENLAYLLIAIAGEIGNNSFDHNLGAWLDVAGVYFKIDLAKRMIALADRGQGVFKTIKRVRPKVATSAEALKIAFTEIISGRFPEKRGNGLKFVRKIVEKNNLKLNFFSGRASCQIDFQGLKIKNEKETIPGTLAFIEF